MFCKPSTNQISTFFSFHPIQPHNTSQKRLPFNENIFFGDQGNKFNRRWLTYDEKNEMLYCTICLVYRNDVSKFRSGFNDWRHITQRVKEHEHSKQAKTFKDKIEVHNFTGKFRMFIFNAM